MIIGSQAGGSLQLTVIINRSALLLHCMSITACRDTFRTLQLFFISVQ